MEYQRAQAVEIRRLSKPFWATVMIGAVSLMAFVTFLAQSLDRNSIKSSERIFRSMMGDRAQHLADITLEYGYWDIAVEHLVYKLNMQWVNETFVDYMRDELQIDGVHVLDGNNNPKLHVVDGALANADLLARYGPSVMDLIGKARATAKDEAPVPATGLIGSLEGLFLASAALMTTYNENNDDKSTDHVLLFAQPINKDVLAAMSERYGLSKLYLSPVKPSFRQAGAAIETPGGNVIGHFVWYPGLEGSRLLPYLMIGVLVVYVSMFLAARLFFRRATVVVRALEDAKWEAEKAREQLADLARKDPLTGLGNRRFLDETLTRLQSPGDRAGKYALLYIDLDRFKEINDTFGHETGDVVLQHVADSLRALVDPEDSIFRLGGDEFAVVFANPKRERVLSSGRAIVEHFSKPLQLNDAVCQYGASVGIAFSADIPDLMRQADIALYAAKRQGRGRMAVYSSELLEFREASEEPVVRRG